MIDTTPQPPVSNRTSKKGVAVGVTAGLVGGALAGLVLGVPGVGSAASDPIVQAVQVAQVDDPDAGTDTDIDTGTETGDETVEPGARLREMLQELVDDGTLTADQADSVTDHLVENQPERTIRDRVRDRGRDRVSDRVQDQRGGPGRTLGSGVLADTLGLDSDELSDELRSGSTLADIAAANGVDTSELVDALVAEVEERMDAAVEAERITAEEAADKLAEIRTSISERINGAD